MNIKRASDMVGRRKRSNTVSNPDALIQALGTLRHILIRDVSSKVTPYGAIDRLASAIISAIDAMADHLTGEERYFATKPHGGFPGPHGPHT